MKPVHGLFNTSLSTKQRLLVKRDNLNRDIDAASLTATLYTGFYHRPTALLALQAAIIFATRSGFMQPGSMGTGGEQASQ